MKSKDNDVVSAAVLNLKYPLEWGSEGLITELHFRRVKFKDIRAVENKSASVASMELVSRLTGMPPPFVDEIDAEDAQEAAKLIEGFMAKSKKDGDSGSEHSQDS